LIPIEKNLVQLSLLEVILFGVDDLSITYKRVIASEAVTNIIDIVKEEFTKISQERNLPIEN